jgi:hypothetical protein
MWRLWSHVQQIKSGFHKYMNRKCLWHAVHSTNLACFLHLVLKVRSKGLKIKVTKCNKYISIYEFNPWSQYHSSPERNHSPGKSYKDLTISHPLFLIRCNWVCANIKIKQSLVWKYNIPASCYPCELPKNVQQRCNSTCDYNVAVNQVCPTFFYRGPQPLWTTHVKATVSGVSSKKKCKTILIQAWTAPEGSRRLGLPDFIKLVRLSALHTGCLYPAGSIPGTHFC